MSVHEDIDLPEIDTEMEDQTIWYLGQISGAGLEAYQFEPRRSLVGNLASDDHGSTSSSDSESSRSEDESSDESERDDGARARLQSLERDFCKCGSCCVDTLMYEDEAICCYGPGFRKITAAEGNRICVTACAEFVDCCLNKPVLLNQLIAIRNLRGDRLDANNVPNRKYRWMAYTAFTWWIYQGKLGHKNRRIIPACVVDRIRGTFPLDEEDDAFAPFEEASDIE